MPREPRQHGPVQGLEQDAGNERPQDRAEERQQHPCKCQRDDNDEGEKGSVFDLPHGCRPAFSLAPYIKRTALESAAYARMKKGRLLSEPPLHS